MKILTTNKNQFDNWINELTVELDKHLTNTYDRLHKNDEKENLPIETYIYKDFGTNMHLIRKFGASRGAIIVNKDNIITSISLNPDNGVDGNNACYENTAIPLVLKYIGYRLFFNNGCDKNNKCNNNGKDKEICKLCK